MKSENNNNTTTTFVRDQVYQFEPPVSVNDAIPQSGKFSYVTKQFSHGEYLNDTDDGNPVFIGSPDNEKKLYFFKIEQTQIDNSSIVIVSATSRK